MVRRTGRIARSPWALLAVAWVLAVGAIALLEHTVGLFSAHELASSPDRLWHGGVWTLVTSSLVIQGPPLGQFLMLVAITAWFVTRLGAGMFWLVALVGHVGATLLTYLGIGVLWLVSHSTVDRLLDAPDFGISAVLAAALGALMVAGWRTGGRRGRLAVGWGVVAALLLALAVGLDGELADVEHLMAYLSGAACAAILLRRLDPGLSYAD